MSNQWSISQLKKDIWLYVFISIILVVSDDTFRFCTSSDRSLADVSKYLLFSLPFLIFLPQRFKSNILALWVGALMALAIMSSLINEGTITGGPIVLSCLFLNAYLVTSIISFQKFSRVFSNLILVGTLYSIIIWLLATIEVINLSYYETTGGASILGFGECFFFYASPFYRNTFVFREPGLFQIMINLAFLFDTLSKKEKLEIHRIVIYSLGIFTTFSTAGYITFGVLLFLYFNHGNISYYKLFVFFSVLIAIYFLLTQSDISDIVFDKVNDNYSNTRSRSAIISFYILIHDIKNLLFGAGVNHIAGLYSEYGKQIFRVHTSINGMLTNTFLNSAATYGLWILVYFFVGFYSLSKRLATFKLIKERYIILIIFLLLFSNEAMYYSLFPHMLVFYGFNHYSFYSVQPKRKPITL